MTCIHLRQLFQLCEEHDLKLSSSDMIRVACPQCGEKEVCPNTLTDEYDARFANLDSDPKETTDEGSNPEEKGGNNSMR